MFLSQCVFCFVFFFCFFSFFLTPFNHGRLYFYSDPPSPHHHKKASYDPVIFYDFSNILYTIKILNHTFYDFSNIFDAGQPCPPIFLLRPPPHITIKQLAMTLLSSMIFPKFCTLLFIPFFLVEYIPLYCSIFSLVYVSYIILTFKFLVLIFNFLALCFCVYIRDLYLLWLFSF